MSNMEYYEVNATEFYEDTVNLDLTQAYRRFFKYVNEDSRILDAGCGSGRDSKFFLSKGHEVVAFDASRKLSELASKNLGQPVKHMRYQEISYIDEFDAIWACASLLHLPEAEIDYVFDKLLHALKNCGIIYASFKYGNDEVEKDGRFFNNYDEEKIEQLIARHPNAEIVEVWKTENTKEARTNKFWLSTIIRKGRK